jgi:UDP-N-acetylglucosamine--N-acetylmuramyl-(pentapeptide) pyrophosphoryl-undecaprenol N-acetylglucosamine transferase
MALVHKSAALYVPDAEAEHTLIAEAINTVKNGKKLLGLSQNIKTLARPNAARDIAEEVIRLAKGGK